MSEADAAGRLFDAIFMDWHMPPGMDGIETARRLRALGLTRPPAVAMVTAYGREEVFREAATAGVEIVLVKPVNPSILFDAAIQALGGTVATGESEAVTADGGADLEAVRGARVLLLVRELPHHLSGAEGVGPEAAEPIRRHPRPHVAHLPGRAQIPLDVQRVPVVQHHHGGLGVPADGSELCSTSPTSALYPCSWSIGPYWYTPSTSRCTVCRAAGEPLEMATMGFQSRSISTSSPQPPPSAPSSSWRWVPHHSMIRSPLT